MPPASKRKSEGKRPHAVKKSKADAVLPAAAASSSSAAPRSSYEKRSPAIQLEADHWPKTSDGLKVVYRTVEFYSLIERRHVHSWGEAVCLAKTCEMDFRYLSADLAPKSLWHLWLEGCRWPELPFRQITASDMPALNARQKIIVDLFDVIRSLSSDTAEVGLAAAVRAGAGHHLQIPFDKGDSLSEILEQLCQSPALSSHYNDAQHYKVIPHIFALCKEMKRTARYPTGKSILLAIGNYELRRSLGDENSYSAVAIQDIRDIRDTENVLAPQSIACQMIRMIPTTGDDECYRVLNWSNGMNNLLASAIHYKCSAVVTALIEHTPTFELQDISFEKVLQSGDEYMIRIFKVGCRRMEVYRRDRSSSVRLLLGDIFPFDLFDLIDAYGAARDTSSIAAAS